jgi:hypothetical protein
MKANCEKESKKSIVGRINAETAKKNDEITKKSFFDIAIEQNISNAFFTLDETK